MASVLKLDTIKSLAGNQAMTITESGVPLLNVPAFSAYLTTNTNFTNSTVLSIDSANGFTLAENFDTHGWFNTSTGMFTPQIAGYYQLNASMRMTGTGLTRAILRIYINDVNTLPVNIDFVPVSTTGGASASALIPFNGTTDQAYMAIYASGTTRTLLGNAEALNSPTRFSGFLVRAAIT